MLPRTRRASRGRAALLACSAILSGSLYATTARADHLTMPETVVQAPAIRPDRGAGEEAARREIERTPGGVAIVGAAALDESRAANLKDALDFVPGVMIRPRFGAAEESQLSIRGSGLRNNFHLRGLNVLIDGFPYGNADGFSDFESLELFATKRIEVYKGANALRFGAGSIGGAINLVTKTGNDAPPLEIASEGGSFGYHKHAVGSGLEAGPWDAYAGFSATELDGFRDFSEQARRRAFAAIGRRFTGGSVVRLDLGYVRNEEDLPGSLTAAELDQDRRQADAENVASASGRDYDYGRGALTLWTPIDETRSIELAVQGNLQDLFHPLSFAILTGDTWSWSAESRYHRVGSLFGLDNRLTVGVQYAGTRQEDVRFENLGDASKGERNRDQVNEATNVGVYGEDRLDLDEHWALVAGGRFQWADREVDDRRPAEGAAGGDSTDFTSFSPKIGVTWRIAPGAQAFANLSHAYEPPLLLELTSPQDLAGGLDDLDAQKAWQFEIGARGRTAARIAWDVAVYDLELRDEILNVNVAPFPGAPFTIPRFRNVDESRHTGVEAGADVDLAAWARLRLAYTWSRFVFVDDDEFGSNDLPGAPEHYLRSELRLAGPAGLWLAPGVEAVPEGYAIDSANEHKTDAYALFGVRAGWMHEPWHLELFVEGRNLLDETYASSVNVDDGNLRFFEPGDGRAFYGGLRWSWS